MMRLMTAMLAAALAGSALISPPAAAQQVPVAPAAAPSARQLDLTRQYINLMMSDQLEDAIRQMIGDEMEGDASAQSLPDADRRFIMDLTAELTTDMVPQMIEEMAPVYAAVFTEEELLALIAFYGTDMGRSISNKTVMVMPEANRAVMAVIPQMMEKMAQRMCQHYGCTAAELEELRRGMRESTGMSGTAAPAPRTK